MPIILGSFYSFLIFLIYPVIIAKRIKYEEEFLEKNLSGYIQYKEKVKFQGVKTESAHKQTHEKVAVKISSRKRQSARNTQKQNIYKDIDNE